MFRKYEQCCFIKTQVACGWNAQQCHKACKYALLHYIAARWVRAFWHGRESGKLILGAGWPLHSSWWDNQVNGVTKTHHAHKNVDSEEGQIEVMFSVAYNYKSMFLAYADSPGITVNTVYYRKFLEHHLCPALHCKWPHCLWSGSTVLHDNAQSQCIYSDRFVQKMELGGSGISTVLTGYMTMWLWFLSGSERTITLHLPQDKIW